MSCRIRGMSFPYHTMYVSPSYPYAYLNYDINYINIIKYAFTALLIIKIVVQNSMKFETKLHWKAKEIQEQENPSKFVTFK